MKILFLLFVLTGLLVTSIPNLAFGLTEIDVFDKVLWSCAPIKRDAAGNFMKFANGTFIPDTTAPAPTIDRDDDGTPGTPKPDRLYFHVVDDDGNDFEVWCLDHGITGDYQFYRSFANGTVTALDKCELICGLNNATLTIVNGTGNLTRIGTGQNFTLDGNIKDYKHDNWVPKGTTSSSDNGTDFHGHYDFKSGKYYRTDTEIISDSPYKDKIISTECEPVPIRETVSYFLPGSNSSPDPEYVIRDGTFANVRLNDYEITNRNNETLLIFTPSNIPLESVEYFEKNLVISLPEMHDDYMSISIPNDLINFEDDNLYSVMVDGEVAEIEDKNLTDTYVTLNFPIDVQASIMIVTAVEKVTPSVGESYDGIIVIVSVAIITMTIIGFLVLRNMKKN